MVQKIKWTKQAKSDLYDIYRFIARDSTRYAQIQIENIQNAVSNLANFPLMGRNVPEFPYLPYREILVGNYRVLYRLEGEKGQIIIHFHFLSSLVFNLAERIKKNCNLLWFLF